MTDVGDRGMQIWVCLNCSAEYEDPPNESIRCFVCGTRAKDIVFGIEPPEDPE